MRLQTRFSKARSWLISRKVSCASSFSENRRCPSASRLAVGSSSMRRRLPKGTRLSRSRASSPPEHCAGHAGRARRRSCGLRRCHYRRQGRTAARRLGCRDAHLSRVGLAQPLPTPASRLIFRFRWGRSADMLPGGNSQTGNMKQRPCSEGDGQVLCFQQSFVQAIHPFGRGKLQFFHAKRQGLCGAPQVPAPNTQENRRFTPPFSACQRNDLQHTHRSEIPCPFYMIEFIIA